MEDMQQLYQELILEHARTPRNFGALPQGTHAEGHNPLCGDHIKVYTLVEGGLVVDVRFEGQGCAISTASASVMTELAKGKPVTEVEGLFTAFHSMVMGKQTGGKLPKKLAVFAGVQAYPMRVKCATLPWHTLHAALRGTQTATTE